MVMKVWEVVAVDFVGKSVGFGGGSGFGSGGSEMGNHLSMKKRAGFGLGLRELALLLEPPLGAELGLRWRLAVDEMEGVVVIGGARGREGVVVREVEDEIGRVLGAVLVLVVYGKFFVLFLLKSL
ncbi:hypothetical protein CMV_027105 [Castanea mollissima]|uniref:Uncharacterized protein n=1 Tax=Castanea mollissima TaxID=60419 RepID=A0A8J4QIV6_9ROSI|nr:hypothetical protein CMV_027105 [Castanea mollissima]